MLSPLEDYDQFYTLPKMVTKDGFQIQISRMGSIHFSKQLDTDYNSGTEIRETIVPTLEQSANRLGGTIIVQTKSQFFYVGHNNDVVENDRNVLQNSCGSTSYLSGGGALDSIFEITCLDHNVYIFGATEDSGESETKQTIDLTDIVAPIRSHFGNKYVPSVRKEWPDLVIWMEGFENDHPGNVVIVGGASPEIAKNFQLLLGFSMMELVPPGENSGSSTERNKRSIQAEWKISPRPLVVPQGYVYSISGEDLEEGQIIQCETEFEGGNPAQFDVARNGTDSYLTDMKSRVQNHTEPTLLVISGFYENEKTPQPSKSRGLKGSMDAGNTKIASKLQKVTIFLPGISLQLGDTNSFKTLAEAKDINVLINEAEKVLAADLTND